MQYKKAFKVHLAKVEQAAETQLTPLEVALVYSGWVAAESAILGVNKPLPALLSSEVQTGHQERSRGLPEASFDARMTRSELQRLSSMLEYNLNEYEEEIALQKYAMQHYWKQCDPDNPDGTSLLFTMLNQTRNSLRSLRKRKAELTAIQTKIKRSLRG